MREQTIIFKIFLKIIWILKWFGRNWVSLLILLVLLDHMSATEFEHAVINTDVVNAYDFTMDYLDAFWDRLFTSL